MTEYRVYAADDEGRVKLFVCEDRNLERYYEQCNFFIKWVGDWKECEELTTCNPYAEYTGYM